MREEKFGKVMLVDVGEVGSYKAADGGACSVKLLWSNVTWWDGAVGKYCLVT